MSDELAGRIAALVGRDHVLVDPQLTAGYETDWTGRFGARARLVVRPGSTEEVAAVIRACSEAGAAVVPQGGNSGLVGGGVPRGGEVLLSLARLDRLDPVDAISGQVTVGAGVTLGAVQAHARAAGLQLGLDHAARDVATVGGSVATNAGGTRALRYGTMRARVAGLEAVLADGTVLSRLAGLAKDNAGYDLPGLFVGSEGTLAVVTAARLRLAPELRRRATVLVALENTQSALELLQVLRRALESLDAVELFYRDGLELVCEQSRLAPPFPVAHPVYVLAECAARDDPLEELAEAVDGADGVLDAAIGADQADRDRLWAYRERHTEAVRATGVQHKLDVSLPLPALPAFERDVRSRIAALAPALQTILWGHLGDGNVHVNVIGAEPDDERVDDTVLQLVAELGGSISAEHGVGVAKVRWLPLTRSEGELDAMRRIKDALDPDGILNPGAVLPVYARS